MTNEYAYKITLQAPCGSKRFAAFHKDHELDLDEVQDEAPQHVTSQTCPRCGSNHKQDEFFAASVDCSLCN